MQNKTICIGNLYQLISGASPIQVISLRFFVTTNTHFHYQYFRNFMTESLKLSMFYYVEI